MDNIFENKLWKTDCKRAFRNALIFGLILVIIWAGLLAILPDGWWIEGINIAFLVTTAFVIGIPSIVFFKPHMPTIVAIINSAVIWVIMVIFIKSVILKLAGVI